MVVAWMLLGTARAEIQLLTARALQPPSSRGGLNHEFEGIAVAPDPAGVEMPADHQRRSIGET
jgi:hypothetical protein